MPERVQLQTRLPVGAADTRSLGWWAMIFVVFTEAALFAYLLFSYYYLAVVVPHTPGTFPLGGPLAVKLAGPNTAILLISSAFVAWAQTGIERGNKWRLVGGLGAGALLGTIFLVIQSFEWGNQKFDIPSSAYSSLYYVVTGFHMAHVLVGVLILMALTVWAAMGYFNRFRYAHIHIGALYWHFVDAVWIAIFFTFYLTPRLGLMS